MERPCLLPTGEAVSPVEAVSFNGIRNMRTAYDSVPQKPDATFRFAPYLADACNHSLFHITDPLSVSPIRKSLTQPGFNGLRDYCRRHASAPWPVCPLDWTHLKREDVLFAVLTTHKLQHRSQLATRSLQLQGARLRIFSNVDGPLTTALPETARIENRNASHPHKDIQFIAQKQLEMLSILDRFGPAKWYAIAAADTSLFVCIPTSNLHGMHMHTHTHTCTCMYRYVIADDDTFLFVDRWLSALGTHAADKSVIVGGGYAYTVVLYAYIQEGMHICGLRRRRVCIYCACSCTRCRMCMRTEPHVHAYAAHAHAARMHPHGAACACTHGACACAHMPTVPHVRTCLLYRMCAHAYCTACAHMPTVPHARTCLLYLMRALLRCGCRSADGRMCMYVCMHVCMYRMCMHVCTPCVCMWLLLSRRAFFACDRRLHSHAQGLTLTLTLTLTPQPRPGPPLRLHLL